MVPTVEAGSYRLETERLGALPILNHFLVRLGLEDRLQRALAALETCSGGSRCMRWATGRVRMPGTSWG